MKVNGLGRQKLRHGRNSGGGKRKLMRNFILTYPRIWEKFLAVAQKNVIRSYILTSSRTWKKFLELGEVKLVPKLYSDLLHRDGSIKISLRTISS